MLIKPFEEKSDDLTTLEALLGAADARQRKLIETEIRNVRAGIAAEKQSAYFIDFEFANSKSWAVIHDLRVEVAGRVAQIDHLLINRLMEVFVLESKSVHAGIKVTDDGEFLRWSDRKKTYEGMASPLAQNERHVAVLADAMKSIELPSRLGLRISPSFEPYVLVSPNARVDRPKNFDTSRVVKSDDLIEKIRRSFDEASAGKILMTVAKLIGQDTLESLAEQLVTLHKPLAIDYRAKFGLAEAPIKDTLDIKTAPAVESDMPACRQCKSSNISILYGKFGYYFKCSDCSGNTPIKISCGKEGHKERIRKEGRHFFRECAECKSSSLFFSNSDLPAGG